MKHRTVSLQYDGLMCFKDFNDNFGGREEGVKVDARYLLVFRDEVLDRFFFILKYKLNIGGRY